jgi:hypothetical protein
MLVTKRFAIFLYQTNPVKRLYLLILQVINLAHQRLINSHQIGKFALKYCKITEMVFLILSHIIIGNFVQS